jgi:hypothetical protein
VGVIATLAIIGILTPTKIHGDISEPEIILNPFESLSETPTPEEIKEAIVYMSPNKEVADQILNTVFCESSFRYNAVGDGGLAYGIAQFHKPTFDEFCEGNYYSTKDQLQCMLKMWETPKLKLHWSCYKNIYGSALR